MAIKERIKTCVVEHGDELFMWSIYLVGFAFGLGTGYLCGCIDGTTKAGEFYYDMARSAIRGK